MSLDPNLEKVVSIAVSRDKSFYSNQSELENEVDRKFCGRPKIRVSQVATDEAGPTQKVNNSVSSFFKKGFFTGLKRLKDTKGKLKKLAYHQWGSGNDSKKRLRELRNRTVQSVWKSLLCALSQRR